MAIRAIRVLNNEILLFFFCYKIFLWNERWSILWIYGIFKFACEISVYKVLWRNFSELPCFWGNKKGFASKSELYYLFYIFLLARI